MLKKTTLAKAIAYALAGAALSAGAISNAAAGVTTMYNLTTSGGDDNSTNTTNPTAGGSWALTGNTDGWIYGLAGSAGNPTNTVAKWAGTTGLRHAPFGYTAPHLNWAIDFNGAGSGEISTFDAFNRYGVYADIDTARGAWSDQALGRPTSGWRHDLDVGLFRSNITGLVTLNAQGILQSGTNFGFTVFKGMNTAPDYNHHGGWNSNNHEPTAANTRLIGGGFNLTVADIVAFSVGSDPASPTTPVGINTLSFLAEANQVYTIALGGYRNGSWGDTIDGYRLTVSQVPVPGAVWLFGTALVGLMGFQRRKTQDA